MSLTRVKSVVRNVVEKSDGTPRPFLGLEHVESGTAKLLVDELPMKAADDSIRFEVGDVLFSKLRPYLAKSLLPAAPGTGTSELLVLRPQATLDPRFLLYVTLSNPWLEWANTTVYGSKMPRTSWELIGDYRFPLLPLEEQRRIADFLDAETARIDRLVQTRDRQLQLVNQQFKSSLEDSFAREGLRPTRLKYLLVSKPRYGVLVPQFADFGVRFIRVNDLLDLPGRAESLRSIPKELSEQYSRTVTRTGDVLLSVVGTMGRAAVVPRELVGANVARAVASLRGHDGVPPELLAAWLSSPSFMRQASLATSSDTAQPTLGMEDLSNFKLSWPVSAGSLHDVLVRVTTARQHRDVLESLLKKQASALSERRQALITAAVTGQFDVSSASGRGVTEGVTNGVSA